MKLLAALDEKYHRRLLAGLLLAAVLAAVVGVKLWGWPLAAAQPAAEADAPLDWQGIYLEDSGVEVHFGELLVSPGQETRRLTVYQQQVTAPVVLTDRLIEILDWDILKKTQQVSYTGTGYFVVDLDKITAADIIEDKQSKTVTIRVGHPHLLALEIDPEKITIGATREGLLARGEIALTVKDYNDIEKQLKDEMTKKLDTGANAQKADDAALRMVKEVYQPVVKAVRPDYTVQVQFR